MLLPFTEKKEVKGGSMPASLNSVLILILLSMTLAACGGGGSTTDSSKTPAASPSPAPSPSPTPSPTPSPSPSLTSTPGECSDSLYDKKMVSNISHNHNGAQFSAVEGVVGSPIDNYEAIQGYLTSAHHYWTLPSLPPGLSINSATGLISGTPTTTQLGGTTITVVDDYTNDWDNSSAQNSCTFSYSLETAGASQTFTPTGAMAALRNNSVAVALSNASNAKVLVVGGTLQTAELFNPATGSFAATTGNMARYGAKTATLLQDGTVLLAGGTKADGVTPELRLEIFDPSTQTFSLTGSSLASLPTSAILLPSGKVLFLEGSSTCDVSSGAKTDYSPEIFNPTTKAVITAPGSNLGGTYGVLLPNGKALIRGYQACFRNAVFGNWFNVFLGTTRLYDPVAQSTAATGTSYTFYDNSAPQQKAGLLLADGTALFADYGGGLNGDLTYIQKYDPATGTWSQEWQQYNDLDYGTPILEPSSGTVLMVNLEYSRINSYNVSTATMNPATHYSVYNHGANGAVVIANTNGNLKPLLVGGSTSKSAEYYNP